MSDATLKHARMSDELERTLIEEAIQAQALSDGPFGRQAWRRLKLRMAAFGGALGEMLHDMDAGRRHHPVISAYRDASRRAVKRRHAMLASFVCHGVVERGCRVTARYWPADSHPAR